MSLEIQKIAMTVPVSDEVLKMAEWSDRFLRAALGLEPDTRTPEQKEADWKAWEAETKRLRAETEAEHEAALATASGLAHAILELHGPTYYDGRRQAHCDGCEFGGYEAEAPDFPCRTYELALEATR